jgi:hypothetical protein
MILLLRENVGTQPKSLVGILNSRVIPNGCCLTHLLAIQPIAMNAPESAAEMNEMHALLTQTLPIIHLTQAYE